MSNPYNWRIGPSQNDLIAFITRGIPVPFLPDFQGFSVRKGRGEGGTAKHGYRRAELLWQKMTRNEAALLYNLVEEVGTGLLYLTIERLDGLKSGNGWMDIAGYPSLSDIAPVGPMLFHGSHTHNNVLLTVNNISILTESPVF